MGARDRDRQMVDRIISAATLTDTQLALYDAATRRSDDYGIGDTAALPSVADQLGATDHDRQAVARMLGLTP